MAKAFAHVYTHALFNTDKSKLNSSDVYHIPWNGSTHYFKKGHSYKNFYRG